MCSVIAAHCKAWAKGMFEEQSLLTRIPTPCAGPMLQYVPSNALLSASWLYALRSLSRVNIVGITQPEQSEQLSRRIQLMEPLGATNTGSFYLN